MSELVIINGEEEFLKERAALEEASASLSPCVFRYNDENGFRLYIERSQLSSLSMQSSVFILSGVSEIPILPCGECDLIICISLPKAKIHDSRARKEYNFPKLKTWDDNNEVIRWILREGESNNIDLSRVANALFVSTGGSLRKISSEIQKLVVLTTQGIVSAELARSVLCFSAKLTPMNVVSAICEGNTLKALTFYDALQYGTDETGWIIAFLQRHVMRQINIISLQKDGLGSDDIAKKIGMHPFRFHKTQDLLFGLWSLSSLVESSRTLVDLDILNKAGNNSVSLGLELEIIRLSEEAGKHNVS